MKEIREILNEFDSLLLTLKSSQEVLDLKSKYLGKNSRLQDILKSLKNADENVKREIGPLAQNARIEIETKTSKKLEQFKKIKIDERLSKNKLDITCTDDKFSNYKFIAGMHPRTILEEEIEEVFLSMGFEIIDGPHIEDDYHNFEALNIPKEHPARDMQDTFWFADKKHLLRTHTSTIQVRAMKDRTPPFKFIAPGLVFRCERTDASHEMIFSQLEGMMVGEDISVANLIYCMKVLLKKIFGKKDIEIRLRPGFFPFVEPGFELDIKCLICGGDGCSVCKHSGWVELLPCGMVHPNVLSYGNIDSKKYTGFAFGLGLDRLVMMRYGIDDIRHLNSGDLRFSSQFRIY